MVRQGHYHLHTEPVSRMKGHSSVAAAAYQSKQSLAHNQQLQGSVSLDHRKQLNKGHVTAGLREELNAAGIQLSDKATAQKDGRRDWTITDENSTYKIREVEKKVLNEATGKRETVDRYLDVYAKRIHNYATREDVAETWIQAPNHAPEWIKAAAAKGDAVEKKEREALWNAVEEADVARDARPARKIQVALIRELSPEQNIAILREYVSEQFVDRGLVADVAIHQKKASDSRLNPHAHILITTREINAQGEFAETKNNYWKSDQRVVDWRKAWTEKVNSALEENGSDTRIDDRSYKKRGVQIIPGEHMGASEWNRAQRGDKTSKAQRNEAIEAQNAKWDQYWSAMQKRVRARNPDYTSENVAEYEKKQERELNKIYEPDTTSLEANSKKIEAVEKKAEAEKEHYAGRITVRRWAGLGSKTTHTYLPGVASLPRKQRMEFAKSTPYMTVAEEQQRLTEYHERTLAGYLGNNQSGGKPQEAMEHIQRMAKTVREKASEVKQQLTEQYSGWVARLRQERKEQRQSKKDHER